MVTLLLVVGGALAISFLCSILEAVLLSITHSFIALAQEQGRKTGAILAKMRENIDEPIAAILTLNTIAHTVGAATGGAIALGVFGEKWLALFSIVLTLAILVLSEILPKTIGATYWQTLATPAAYLLLGMVTLMKPILIPLRAMNRLLTPPGKKAAKVSRAEIEVLADIGRREGTIDEEEWRIVNNVMNLDEVAVGAVMTPRTSMVAVSVDATVDAAAELMLSEGHLRLPVYEDSIDQVVGVLLARDLWRAQREGITDIKTLVRPAQFVPESKAAEELIKEMRQLRTKMAIVLDEFGGTAGLVTLEDLIEEIVGEIQDEHEQEPLPFEASAKGEIRMSGSAPLREVNERFNLDLPEDDFDTVGGYVFGQLGHIPEPGEEIEFTAGKLRVLSMDGRRVARVAFAPAVRNLAASDGGISSLPDNFRG